MHAHAAHIALRAGRRRGRERHTGQPASPHHHAAAAAAPITYYAAANLPAQIIVETNFRVYAYTTSYVDFQILSRFATVVEKFPDMCAPSCPRSRPPAL